ncbi:MAG: GNAT family N-acetyltransferase [Paracoccus sp. (in: a-proteobacteria)]|uniref:GNAT family N-acetyltransferase n=1 Tax=unclassified Paracoccus (in: a-proteobacteria) TaxID=2688777 RepID=UPI000C626D6A|nr:MULTISPECIES: GNAT family N-acetyltransferase [unclassified Paracoccus (in: a-proteobacteria)]MAN55379.1 GNAT family N-acetyltransferase [Paracoccus sp. (in: a-proteobacteria)]MBA48429.1 GNAT family N-acetyltransferase [Paracoccus sp. (in: a-proteobacteria)]|tara:strand:- start:1508 stop:2317 length:810 start_codon:yes stop_codon:yes gene_type:complete
MSCACGHHHPRHETGCEAEGPTIALDRPMIALTGRLICADPAQLMTALTLLPDHVDQSRAEPGCLRFDLRQDEDPLVWHLSELFTDGEAFAAHQQRTKASAWGRDSRDIARDFHRREAMPAIRPERRPDADAISRLLRDAFAGEVEARLVEALRAAGDLSMSLVAEADGMILGHVGLSPMTGDEAAFALAPVAVAPAMQRRGIGQALVRAALAGAGSRPVVVLGAPDYYARLGFRPADLDSPHAGPFLQVAGDLPAGARIRHAPAFEAV